MKLLASTLLGTLLYAAVAAAQPGPRGGMGMGGPAGPGISASTAQLLGENTEFSADVEVETHGPGPGSAATIPGQMAFDHGKCRFAMDLAEIKGGQIPPGAAAQMKTMGMDKMVVISRPDRKMQYMVYPGLKSYAEIQSTENTDANPADFKVQLTELGKEAIDGHPCVKNKAVVTDKEGQKHESVVWNATDLKKFPIKMEVNEQGEPSTMLFKNVKLSKPAAALFDPPAGFTKYDSFMAMMQQAMMKRMAPPGGTAPGAPPPSSAPPPPPKQP